MGLSFNKISKEHLQQFIQIVGAEHVLLTDEHRKNYSHDYTEDLSFLPEVILRPSSAAEISSILKICNKEMIPVTPRGAGTGLSGGALPVHAGVVISTERLNKII